MQDLLIANFDTGVVTNGKHNRASMPYGYRKIAPTGLTLAETVVKHGVVAVIMQKRLEDWLASLQSILDTNLPFGLKAAIVKLFPGIQDSMDTAITAYETYYAEWEEVTAVSPQNFFHVPYERALGETRAVLSELADVYMIPLLKETWDLMNTYQGGSAKRKRYLKGTKWEKPLDTMIRQGET
jgi:hypothetical protein